MSYFLLKIFFTDFCTSNDLYTETSFVGDDKIKLKKAPQFFLSISTCTKNGVLHLFFFTYIFFFGVCLELGYYDGLCHGSIVYCLMKFMA